MDVCSSVSDPGHFYTDPDQTQNKNTDPDPIRRITQYIHMFFKVLSDCSKVEIHDFEGFFFVFFIN